MSARFACNGYGVQYECVLMASHTTDQSDDTRAQCFRAQYECNYAKQATTRVCIPRARGVAGAIIHDA
jgi:hypothetical protein